MFVNSVGIELASFGGLSCSYAICVYDCRLVCWGLIV